MYDSLFKVRETMNNEYIKAYKKGVRAYQKAVLEGRYPFLPALDDILQEANTMSEYPVGLMEVPLDFFAGTKTRGRQEAFAENFMPILEERSEFAMKWEKLFEAQTEEGIRDPVKVYEYMWKFYVLEGNKRVSVLKYLDVPKIMADITRIIPSDEEDQTVQIYKEFVDFFNAVPIYDMVFSSKGSYRKLAELIGKDLSKPWPDEDVIDLRSAFSVFEIVFHQKGGDSLNITAADAFLIYLGIYDLRTLLDETPKEYTEKIERIWNEFRVESSDDNIAFVEDPDLTKKDVIPIPLLSPLLNKPPYSKSKPLRMTFIYDKNPVDSSWIYGHELGRNQVTDAFDGLVVTEAIQDCGDEEKFTSAVESAAKTSDMIITPSSAQMDMTLKAAIQYPDVKFLNCSINLSHSAVRTYYGRMFEAKFLMGALAASLCENHKIGYVADYPIFGTVANINAFAIGAALADPESRIYLTWTAIQNTDWRQELKAKDINVLSGPDLIRPAEMSREYGIYKRYGEDIYNLAMPVWDWGKYYELIVQTILNDTWPEKKTARSDQALNYWWGMSAGVIDVILSKRLSYYSFKMVEAIKRSMLAGTMHPFAGELHAQDGVLIRGSGEEGRLTNEEIVSMDWLNDNVIGSLPRIDDLTETGVKTVKVSGVIEV